MHALPDPHLGLHHSCRAYDIVGDSSGKHDVLAAVVVSTYAIVKSERIAWCRHNPRPSAFRSLLSR